MEKLFNEIEKRCNESKKKKNNNQNKLIINYSS